MTGRPGLLESRTGRVLVAALLPLALLALWEGCGRLDLLPSYLIAPSAIVASTWELAASGELALHTGVTLYRALAGFAIGCVCGVFLGLLAGVSRPVERFYDPIISLTYPVPKIVVLPILIAWLGSGSASKIAVITAACFYPSFINAYYGAKGVAKLHVWSALNMGASRWQTFRKIVLPSSLPQIFAGLRIASALALIVTIAAEMSGSRNGLGFLIMTAEDSLRFDLMYAAIVAIALIGFASDRALGSARRGLLVGQATATEERRV